MEETIAQRPKKQLKRVKKIDKIESRVQKLVGKAIGDFAMIEPNDRILVAISGGKDSWALLRILNLLKAKAPISFSLVAVNLDQGYRGFRQDIIQEYVAAHNFEYFMEEINIAEIIEQKSPDDLPCSLCARLRRGKLSGLAKKYQCNKIALGHHLDDFIETLLLNAFYIGRLASMAPKLLPREQGQGITVIRPLVLVPEKLIVEYAEQVGFPIVCCQCPLMCGQNTLSDPKRIFIKNLIGQLEKKIPHIRSSLLASLGNVKPSHLMDRNLWPPQ